MLREAVNQTDGEGRKLRNVGVPCVPQGLNGKINTPAGYDSMADGFEEWPSKLTRKVTYEVPPPPPAPARLHMHTHLFCSSLAGSLDRGMCRVLHADERRILPMSLRVCCRLNF